jgi:hypothetical protein
MEGLNGYGESAVMDDSPGARFAGDEKLRVTFYMKAVKNNFKSDQEGRPIFDEKPYVRILIPGDRNSNLDQPVKKIHMHRFADRWKRFEENSKQSESGTPLEAWPQMTVGRVAELKYLNISTVEHLAELSDTHGQQIPDFNDLKRRALAFLEAAKGEAVNSKIASELKKRDGEIASLKQQIEQLIEGLNSQKTEAKTPSKK